MVGGVQFGAGLCGRVGSVGSLLAFTRGGGFLRFALYCPLRGLLAGADIGLDAGKGWPLPRQGAALWRVMAQPACLNACRFR